MNIIVLSLSLVSLASAAGSAEREIIARQARKIQSQADEIKALKKADMRRRLLFFRGLGGGSDSESDSSDSSDAEAWCGFVSDYIGKKNNAITTNQRRRLMQGGGTPFGGGSSGEPSDDSSDSDYSAPAPAPAPAPSPVPLYHSGPYFTTVPPPSNNSIGRCNSISSSEMDQVPAFKLFVDALKDNPLYNGSATVNCITCSLKNIYKPYVGEEPACEDGSDSDERIERNTANPLVVMAPNTWLNDPGCLDLIDPSEEACGALENCVMPVPAFQDLQDLILGGENATVYTAEAVMEFFQMNLPVSSFNFILSQYMAYADNPVVFSEAMYEETRENFILEDQAMYEETRENFNLEESVLNACKPDFDLFCSGEQEITIDVMYNCLKSKPPVEGRRKLQHERPPLIRTRSQLPLETTVADNSGALGGGIKPQSGDRTAYPLSDKCAHGLATYEHERQEKGDENPRPPSPFSAVVLGAGQQKSFLPPKNHQRRRRLQTQIPNGLS